MKQTTLANSFFVEGKGLHNGENGKVTFLPAPAGTGYMIRSGKDEGLVRPWRIDGSRNRSIITLEKGTQIHTVEHALAALYGMGVDNAILEVEGNEIPGGDGSAKVFADHIAAVGVKELEEEAFFFQIEKEACAGAYGCTITATPIKERELRLTYTIDYPESPLAQGTVEKTITPEIFLNEIAPARTFVMKSQIEALQNAGLGKGANTQNTLVLDGAEVLQNALHFDGEPAAHKMLDIMGDLATVGFRMGGHIVARKSGHLLNNKLAGKLLLDGLEQKHPGGVKNIKDIENTLPHRYPFLLVDRVIECVPMKRVVAYKNLTRNEPFFNGHFPGQPIMPGVLQIEAMAQASGLGLLDNQDETLAVLTGVDDVKFRRQVVPGDRLLMEITVEKYNGRLGAIVGRATVDGDLACSATIKFAFINRSTGTI